jgi:hypothetical protein
MRHRCRRLLPRRAAPVVALVVALVALLLCAASPLGAGEPGGAQAGPTVAQLLAACARGQSAGDAGVDAALCEWYAVPCDCSAKSAGPRWCMPENESIDAALPRVLAALRTEPRQSAPAVLVVPEVMAGLYPCATAARR